MKNCNKPSKLFKLFRFLGILGIILTLVGGGALAINYPYGKEIETIINPSKMQTISESEEFFLPNLVNLQIQGNFNANIKNYPSGEEKNVISVQAKGTVASMGVGKSKLNIVATDYSLSIRFSNILLSVYQSCKVDLDVFLPSSYAGNLTVDNISKTTTITATNYFKNVSLTNSAGATIASNLNAVTLKTDLTSGELSLTNVKTDNTLISISSGRGIINGLTGSTLNLSMTSGNVDFSDVVVDSFISDVSSGKVTVNNFKAPIIEIKATSGNFIAQRLNTSSLYIDISSGSVNLNLTTIPNITSNSTSGSITLAMPPYPKTGDLNGFKFVAKMSSGKIINNYFKNQSSVFNGDTSFSQGDTTTRNFYFSLSSGVITINEN